MSEVNRLEMDHKGLPFVDENGVYVLYEDYAAMKQRAEAAEAENARLTRNYKHIIEQHMPRTSDGCDKGWTRVIEAHELQAKLEAAEAKLAELVPPEADGSNLPFAANGWNACRAEILRKIEEAK